MRWDPAQYGRYAGERGRPYVDLLARVDCESPRRVVDLGCGPGDLTEALPQRWPDTVIEGLDSSSEMIAVAQARNGRAAYRVADVTDWSPDADADVVISNAVLQWVPTHRDLLRRWAGELSPGAWLAFQVPGNFRAPSHQIMRELTLSPHWASLLGDVLRYDDVVAEPEEYATLLLDCGLSVDVWETTYLHLLHGPDPVLEWVRGTGLRPVLAKLDAEDAAQFESEYAARLRTAYPATTHGTLFPFRRIFAVAHKP